MEYSRMSHYHDQAIADAAYTAKWRPLWRAALERNRKAIASSPVMLQEQDWPWDAPMHEQITYLNEWSDDIERLVRKYKEAEVECEAARANLAEVRKRVEEFERCQPPPEPPLRLPFFWLIITAALILLNILLFTSRS